MEKLDQLQNSIIHHPEAQERIRRIQRMTPEQKDAERKRLLATDGIVLDEKGREIFPYPSGPTAEVRLKSGGFPQAAKFKRFQEQNTNYTKCQADIHQAFRSGKWLYLSGQPLVGKTSLAIFLAYRFLQKKRYDKATYYSFPFLLEELLASKEQLHTILAKWGRLVVLDDLPQNPKNHWVQETILKILLYLEGRPTGQVVLVSNCPMKQIFEYKDETLQRAKAKLLDSAHEAIISK